MKDNLIIFRVEILYFNQKKEATNSSEGETVVNFLLY